MSGILIRHCDELVSHVSMRASYPGARLRYALACINNTRSTKVTNTSISDVRNNDVVLGLRKCRNTMDKNDESAYRFDIRMDNTIVVEIRKALGDARNLQRKLNNTK